MGGRCPPRREGEPRLDDACGGAKYSEEPEKVPLQPSAENLVLMLSSLRLLPLDVGLVNMLGGTGIENLFEWRCSSAMRACSSLFPAVGYSASVSDIARSNGSIPSNFPERAVDASIRKTLMSRLGGTEWYSSSRQRRKHEYACCSSVEANPMNMSSVLSFTDLGVDKVSPTCPRLADFR